MDKPFEEWYGEEPFVSELVPNGMWYYKYAEKKAAMSRAFRAGQKSCEPLIWQLIQHIDDKAGTDETEHDFVERIKKEVENQIP
jgi:hypothetical protein